MMNWKRVGLYVFLAYALSWSLFGLYFVLGGRWESPWTLAVLIVYMLMPALSATLVVRGLCKEPVLSTLSVTFRPNRWWLLAGLLPAVLALAAMGVSLLMPGAAYDASIAGFLHRAAPKLQGAQYDQVVAQLRHLPIHPFWLILVQGIIAGFTVNAVAGFGEELGWRGLMQKELSPLGFWRMSAAIGAVWGLWHAPIILQGYNYPTHPVAGVFMMTGWTVLLTPIFCYVRLRSGSVIGASILHGALNGTAGLGVVLVSGGSDLTVGMLGLAGFIVLTVADLCIYFFGFRHG